MLWPESDTIAAKLPQFGILIGQIDKLLAENTGSLVPFCHFETFCGVDSQRLLRVLAEYAALGVVTEVQMVQCPEHLDVRELLPSGMHSFRCDQCEAEIDSSSWVPAIGYQITLRTFRPGSNDHSSLEPIGGRRFAIAFSFPGLHRDKVRSIANTLSEQVGRSRLLFDEFHKPEFSRPNLDLHLQQLYLRESSLVVVFLCEAYNANEWCGLEWRAIRSMIKEGRDSELMLVRLDNGYVDGIFGIDGFIDAQKTPLVEVAYLIQERLRQVTGEIKLVSKQSSELEFLNRLPSNAVGKVLRTILHRNPERWILLQSNASPNLETVSSHFDRANLWFIRSDRMIGFASSVYLHTALCCLAAAMKELFEQTKTSEQLLIDTCQFLARTSGSKSLINSKNVSAFYSKSSDLRSAMRDIGFDSQITDDLERD